MIRYEGSGYFFIKGDADSTDSPMFMLTNIHHNQEGCEFIFIVAAERERPDEAPRAEVSIHLSQDQATELMEWLKKNLASKN